VGAITTLPVRAPAEVLAAFDAYDDRSLIGNAEYRRIWQTFFLTQGRIKAYAWANSPYLFGTYFSLPP
jgi:hypothetical protein